MQHQTARPGDGYWISLPALVQIERLEAACHRVMLPAGGEAERRALRQMLPLDLCASVGPHSTAASIARTAADQIGGLIAILDEDHPDSLVLRVAAARLCQTLANMRGHLSGGRRVRDAANGKRTNVAS